MGYKDYNGKITIDEVAANKDVKRFREAISKLEAARNSVNQLIQQGSQTRGNTGNAIVSKGNEIKRQLDMLINNLNNEISVINKTVAKYKRLDQEVKAMITR